MAVEQSFEVFSGNDVVLAPTITDADNADAPLSLAGVQEIIWALAKAAKGTAIITKTLTASGGILITNSAQGLVEVTLTQADLEPLAGDFYHEMRITNALGQKVTVMYGIVTIRVNLIRS